MVLRKILTIILRNGVLDEMTKRKIASKVLSRWIILKFPFTSNNYYQ